VINANKAYSYVSILLINLMPILCLIKYDWVIYMLLQPIVIMLSAVFYKSTLDIYYLLKRVNKAIIVFYCSTYLALIVLYVVYPSIINLIRK
jgi:hypothetical protein